MAGAPYRFTGAEERPMAPQEPAALALAARYAPILLFDAREPFLPSAAGYTIFYADAPSPSFPRHVELAPEGRPAAACAIEYAIWWDWDINHLYELEHIWVFLDAAGRVVWAEASWHGGMFPAVDQRGAPPIDGDRVVLYAEPGKHAFAPTPARLLDRRAITLASCGRYAGVGGVLVTRLFEGVIDSKTPLADRLVHTFLEQHAFEPGYEFSRRFALSTDLLVPWEALRAYIPARVAWIVRDLAARIPPHERRFLRVAHRGASEQAPENTLKAFMLAREQGADLVELDVQLTADGVPVVLHDARLERTTALDGLVSERTLAEIKAVAGDQLTGVPALAEVFEWARANPIGLYIELKAPGTPAGVVELLREPGMRGQVLLASFDPELVAEAKALAPRVPAAILFKDQQVDPVALARRCGADYVHPCWEAHPQPHTLLTPAWIEAVRAAGLGVVAWHEERRDELIALRRVGVDAICSNRPDLLREVAQTPLAP